MPYVLNFLSAGTAAAAGVRRILNNGRDYRSRARTRVRTIVECPRNTRIPGIPGILVGIVSALQANFRRFFKNPAGSATQTSTRNSGRTCVLACFKSTGGRQGGSLCRRQGGSPFDGCHLT
jgi:hypothetical protein